MGNLSNRRGWGTVLGCEKLRTAYWKRFALPLTAFAIVGCGGLSADYDSALYRPAISAASKTATVKSVVPTAHSAGATSLTGSSARSAASSIQSRTSQFPSIDENEIYETPSSIASTGTKIDLSDQNVSANMSGWVARPQIPPATYGSGVQFDVMDNIQVAQGDADYRFLAQYSGVLKSIIWYDAYKEGGSFPGCTGAACGCDGYGCGTGGNIEICIYSDDETPEHLPTDPLTQQSTGLEAQPLACVTPAGLRSGSSIRTETFPAPPELVAGMIYHLHWHNSSPDSANNFVSVDDACVWHSTTPRQPTISDINLGALSIYNNGAEVVTNTMAGDTPIFQLNYSDGNTQGQGYIGSWIGDPASISGTSQVREWFVVSGTSRTLTGVSVRVNLVSGASPLTVTLATSTGVNIEQGEIPASQFPFGNALTSDAEASRYVTSAWGSYTFSTSPVLSSGQDYQLILSAPEGTLYQGYGIEKGKGYGFTDSTYFSDGYGQFSLDNGRSWMGFTQPGGPANNSNADIQFYFTTQ